MKELYISPEVELIGFVAEERLANNFVDFGKLDDSTVQFPGLDDSEESKAGDIRLPFPKL